MRDNKDFERKPVGEDQQEEGSGKKGVLTLFGHEAAKKKAIAVGFGIACAAALLALGAYTLSTQPLTPQPIHAGSGSAAQSSSGAMAGSGSAEAVGSADKQSGDAAETAKENEETPEVNDGGNNAPAPSDSTSSGKESAKQPNTASNASASSENKPQGHTHSWVEQTTVVHHDAVTHTEPAYGTVHYPGTPKAVCICGGCGGWFDTDDEWSAHAKAQMLAGNFSCGSYSTRTVYVGEPYESQEVVGYTTITDQPAYDETVTTGYTCSCGATK